jgi:hypothetical protein
MLALDTRGRILRQEHHADAITSGLRQRDRAVSANSPKKCMWDLQQNACAIAGAGVGSNSAPVGKILEKLERFLYNVARANAMDVRDEADAARIMFVGRVI